MLIFAFIFDLQQDQSHQLQAYSQNLIRQTGLPSNGLRYACATLSGYFGATVPGDVSFNLLEAK